MTPSGKNLPLGYPWIPAFAGMTKEEGRAYACNQKARPYKRIRYDMSATNITRCIGIGLLGLPIYGALTFWSSMNPQPDPSTHYGAWSRFVTTDHYVWTHVMGSIVGRILAIFGTFALGASLADSRAGRLGLVAMVLTVLGCALFLPAMGSQPPGNSLCPRGQAGDENNYWIPAFAGMTRKGGPPVFTRPRPELSPVRTDSS